MGDATCKTCYFATLLAERGEGREIRCHNATAWFGTVYHREDWWCSEHPARQRDRLAAMAMQAILPTASAQSEEQVPAMLRQVAKAAYAAADALLAEREKGGPGHG